ncbi:MAG TPA: c-type cytochrome domain-containing protein, partial [Flavitalea sp.]|nr:c-type cytochrome domain-containing protein [Flavitalea sp.]
MSRIKTVFNKRIFIVIAALTGSILVFTFSTDHNEIDFNTQVKPIFNNKCIACHGGVKRKAGFSLLFESEAMANTESGKPAIIPGKPDQSEL